MYFNCVVQVAVQRRADAWLRRTIAASGGSLSAATDPLSPLPDLGFEWLPHLREAWLADAWVGATLVLTIVRFVITARRMIIFRRFLLILGWMFLLRGVCISVTMLPNPLAGCVASTADSGSAFAQGFLIMVLARKTCADVLFSGHTVNLTLAALTWHTYSHIAPIAVGGRLDSLLCGCNAVPLHGPASAQDLARCTIVKTAAWAAAACGYFVIIATRFHYTIDTLVALVLTVLSWKIFHAYVRTTAARPNRFNRIVEWFERDAEEALRCELAPLTDRLRQRRRRQHNYKTRERGPADALLNEEEARVTDDTTSSAAKAAAAEAAEAGVMTTVSPEQIV
jgi:hypothetical protein